MISATLPSAAFLLGRLGGARLAAGGESWSQFPLPAGRGDARTACLVDTSDTGLLLLGGLYGNHT